MSALGWWCGVLGKLQPNHSNTGLTSTHAIKIPKKKRVQCVGGWQIGPSCELATLACNHSYLQLCNWFTLNFEAEMAPPKNMPQPTICLKQAAQKVSKPYSARSPHREEKKKKTLQFDAPDPQKAVRKGLNLHQPSRKMNLKSRF